jgi:hypothetical protein
MIGPEVEMLEKICASSGPTKDVAGARQRNCPVETGVEGPCLAWAGGEARLMRAKFEG